VSKTFEITIYRYSELDEMAQEQARSFHKLDTSIEVKDFGWIEEIMTMFLNYNLSEPSINGTTLELNDDCMHECPDLILPRTKISKIKALTKIAEHGGIELRAAFNCTLNKNDDFVIIWKHHICNEVKSLGPDFMKKLKEEMKYFQKEIDKVIKSVVRKAREVYKRHAASIEKSKKVDFNKTFKNDYFTKTGLLMSDIMVMNLRNWSK
jgi:hypothetical protein